MANNATGLKYNNTGFLYSFRPEKIVQSIVFPVVLMEWGLNVDDSTQRNRISENWHIEDKTSLWRMKTIKKRKP